MDSESEQLKKIHDRLLYYKEKTGLDDKEIMDRILGMSCDEVVCFHRKLARERTDKKPVKLKAVGILGASHISRGISKLFALRGVHVKLYDPQSEILKEFDNLLDQNLKWMITKWELNKTEKKLIQQHIMHSTQIEVLKNVDLVFDTLRCSFGQRLKIYSELETLIDGDVPIGIDDETIYITNFANKTISPKRVVGVHFTYPASRRNLIEVFRGQQTDEKTFNKMFAVAEYLGKRAFDVFESPGIISTRIMIPFINEAIRVWTEGIASARDIDEIMSLAMNLPMGPLEYADTMGLDNVFATMENLWNLYGLPQFRPEPRLRLLIRMNFLGKRTGRGFHIYDQEMIGEAP